MVAGGGSALVKVSSKLFLKHQEAKKDVDDLAKVEFWAGYTAVAESLLEPLKQIVRNTGKADDGVVLDKVVNGESSFGYNAMTDEYVADMYKSGIVDPVKVTRSALENASSAVAILLTTEVAIADEPEENSSAGRGHSHGAPGMDMGY